MRIHAVMRKRNVVVSKKGADRATMFSCPAMKTWKMLRTRRAFAVARKLSAYGSGRCVKRGADPGPSAAPWRYRKETQEIKPFRVLRVVHFSALRLDFYLANVLTFNCSWKNPTATGTLPVSCLMGKYAGTTTLNPAWLFTSRGAYP